MKVKKNLGGWMLAVALTGMLCGSKVLHAQTRDNACIQGPKLNGPDSCFRASVEYGVHRSAANGSQGNSTLATIEKNWADWDGWAGETHTGLKLQVGVANLAVNEGDHFVKGTPLLGLKFSLAEGFTLLPIDFTDPEVGTVGLAALGGPVRHGSGKTIISAVPFELLVDRNEWNTGLSLFTIQSETRQALGKYLEVEAALRGGIVVMDGASKMSSVGNSGYGEAEGLIRANVTDKLSLSAGVNTRLLPYTLVNGETDARSTYRAGSKGFTLGGQYRIGARSGK